MKLLDWIGAQLNEPTKVLHAIGVIGIAGEFIRHFVTGKPIDYQVITASFGSITLAITQDRINTPPVKPPTA